MHNKLALLVSNSTSNAYVLPSWIKNALKNGASPSTESNEMWEMLDSRNLVEIVKACKGSGIEMFFN